MNDIVQLFHILWCKITFYHNYEMEYTNFHNIFFIYFKWWVFKSFEYQIFQREFQVWFFQEHKYLFFIYFPKNYSKSLNIKILEYYFWCVYFFFLLGKLSGAGKQDFMKCFHFYISQHHFFYINILNMKE